MIKKVTASGKPYPFLHSKNRFQAVLKGRAAAIKLSKRVFNGLIIKMLNYPIEHFASVLFYFKQNRSIREKFSSSHSYIDFFSSAAISQPIVGIGELRIGMPEDEFLNLQDIKSKNTQDASSKKFNSSDRDVWKKNHESAVPDSYARMPQYWKIYTPEYVVYEFKFATGIKDISGKDSYDATVDFYKKELISVRLI